VVKVLVKWVVKTFTKLSTTWYMLGKLLVNVASFGDDFGGEA